SSMERLDIDTGIKKYKDSYFYTVLKIIIIQLLVQYSILTSIGLISKIYVIDAHLLAFYWALAWLLGNIIACSLFYLKLKSVYDFNFPYKAVAKYLFASLVPSLVAFIIKPKQVSLNFFLQLLNAIIPIAVYFIVFLASLMLLDKSMRSRIYLLIRTALNYFKSTL
ncbi:MAG TPA: hypothetical protein VKU94_00975, partial [Geobacterales bacterium]|nr:hypothetical protein [Geobacterales bacterium]